MTYYLNNKICIVPERRIAIYCAVHDLDFNDVTAPRRVKAACKRHPILKKENKDGQEYTFDITTDVAWEYAGNKTAIERVQNKITAYKQYKQNKLYKAHIKADKATSQPNLDNLVDALYSFNIVDEASYLAVVYFLMQLKATRNQKMAKNRESQKIALFLSGIQGNGKSTFANCIMDTEKDYGQINWVNDAEAFESRFEENLWKAHLNFCDEVVPSGISRNRLIRAIDGGLFQLERKNQNPYSYDVNTNLIFASNDSISLKQRRISLVKFGNPIQTLLPFEELKGEMKKIMDSLPDFRWHGEIYKKISRTNQTQLNPLGLESISKFLGEKFGTTRPEDNKKIRFNTSQIFDMLKDKPGKEFLKSDRKEAIRDALDYMAEKDYIDVFKYESCTTKQYTIDTKQYFAFREWSDAKNTSDEKNVKITKQELRNLLAPYFEPITPYYRGTYKQILPGIIVLPAPAKLLALPSPDCFNKTNVQQNKIKELSIDLETFSDEDVKQNGVYKYTESPNFDILLFAYSVNGGDVKVVDLASGDKVPNDIIKSLTDDTVIKWAFNANFERVCLSAWLRKYYPQYFKGYQSNEGALQNYLDPTSWRCTMVWSNYLGLPHSLEAVGAELGLAEQKMKEGKGLIKYFCCPCEATAKNNMRTRNLPEHNPEGWETFKCYNKRDVEVELTIKDRLKYNPVPDDVWQQYAIDQKINDRGVRIDTTFVQKAIEVDKRDRKASYDELKHLTNIENPNSTIQLRDWLKSQGVVTDSLDKKAIEQLLSELTDGSVHQVLGLKQQLAKSSVKKYTRMLNMTAQDGRARGSFMFYGAITTGRWAGRGIQLQNLPQNHLGKLDEARNAIINMDYTAMKETFISEDGKTIYNTPGALSQLLRTALVPEMGYKFIVADYSQIEARVLSAIAGEQWRLDAFASGKDIYCESASQMFNKPVVKNGINGELRVKGKIAELALGYGGGESALVSMGALNMGLNKEELPSLVDQWRSANPRIVEFWKKCDRAAIKTIKNRTGVEVDNIRFWCPENVLYIDLPSGRSLAYRSPEIKKDENGYDKIVYRGEKDKKLKEVGTYGAKLVENIVQGISRDILAYALGNLSAYRIVAHVHDEIIVEVPMDTQIQTICDIMGQTPSWIAGLPLKAEGYECPYYQKQ